MKNLIVILFAALVLSVGCQSKKADATIDAAVESDTTVDASDADTASTDVDATDADSVDAAEDVSAVDAAVDVSATAD